jgi:uncharacterized protein
MNNFFTQLKSDLQKKNPLYIKVKVIPKSPKNEIVEIMADGTYKIRIAAPPTDGKANAELLKFLRKSLGLSEAVIVSGQKDRVKLLRLSL